MLTDPMTQEEATQLVEKSGRFKLSSMQHLDAEALGSFSIVEDDDAALIIQSRFNRRTLLHWAVNDVRVLVSNLKSLLKTGSIQEGTEIEFVPEDCIEALERMGFSALSEWVDYWRSPLEPVDIEVPEGLVIRRAAADEYAGAAEITQACRGLSRGYLGETPDWIKEWDQRAHSMVYIALMGDIPVGLCCASIYGFDRIDGPTMWLRELAVDPLYHRRKIGLSLMVKAMEWGASQGAARSFLACDAENRMGIRLYEGLGYRRASQRGQINMVYHNRWTRHHDWRLAAL